MPRLVEFDHPGLMTCIDHETFADDLAVNGFTPARKQSRQGQPGALLDVCPDPVFLPPPATPATHDDALGFVEMIMFYHLGGYSLARCRRPESTRSQSNRGDREGGDQQRIALYTCRCHRRLVQSFHQRSSGLRG